MLGKIIASFRASHLDHAFCRRPIVVVLWQVEKGGRHRVPAVTLHSGAQPSAFSSQAFDFSPESLQTAVAPSNDPNIPLAHRRLEMWVRGVMAVGVGGKLMGYTLLDEVVGYTLPGGVVDHAVLRRSLGETLIRCLRNAEVVSE